MQSPAVVSREQRFPSVPALAASARSAAGAYDEAIARWEDDGGRVRPAEESASAGRRSHRAAASPWSFPSH